MSEIILIQQFSTQFADPAGGAAAPLGRQAVQSVFESLQPPRGDFIGFADKLVDQLGAGPSVGQLALPSHAEIATAPPFPGGVEAMPAGQADTGGLLRSLMGLRSGIPIPIPETNDSPTGHTPGQPGDVSGPATGATPLDRLISLFEGLSGLQDQLNFGKTGSFAIGGRIGGGRSPQEDLMGPERQGFPGGGLSPAKGMDKAFGGGSLGDVKVHDDGKSDTSGATAYGTSTGASSSTDPVDHEVVHITQKPTGSGASAKRTDGEQAPRGEVTIQDPTKSKDSDPLIRRDESAPTGTFDRIAGSPFGRPPVFDPVQAEPRDPNVKITGEIPDKGDIDPLDPDV
ncbi:MAG: hypothetical protein JXQ27_10010 [Acidobacteria bacterium]|nr:hypothetical protein [Acidobacteriota bacterium]